jgi:hypothetical protein
MPRRSRRPLPHLDMPIETTTELLCTSTFLSGAAFAEETEQIKAAPDAVTRAKLASARIQRHLDNAHAAMVFAHVRGVDARGILREPERQRREMQRIVDELTIALAAYEGVTWRP